MKIIDLSQPLFDHMPVFPGDPEVEIKRVLNVTSDGWNMSSISLPAHLATHLNVPIHATENGKNLDNYKISDFIGLSIVFENLESLVEGRGVLFKKAPIDTKTVNKILSIRPKFVGIEGYFESDKELEVEKLLLKNEILSYEGLININKLPKHREFMFYGVPLKIKDGDGSPIRAFAVL